MSRWIDADAIDYRNDKLIDKSVEFLNGVIYMATRIGEAPSIDIVRCKECKHKDPIVNYCHENDRNIIADDFCSYGERREP